MIVKVQTKDYSTNSLQVQVKTPPVINTDIKRVQVSLAKLEELKDVDASGLQDGYTLVYDAVTETWVTQQITAVGIGNIDGGMY